MYVFINLSAVIALIVTLGVLGEHVSADTALLKFENLSGWSNDGMAFLYSLTAPIWCLTGYDSVAHIAEETRHADMAAPLAILSAVGGTSSLGFCLAIVAAFAVTDIDRSNSSPTGMPMAQLLLDHLGKKGMLAIWSFVIVVQFNTATAQLVDASRVVYAFSRDRALPLSNLWSRMNIKTQTPVLATWFVMMASAILGLLTLQDQAGNALFSCAVIACMYHTQFLLAFVSPTTGSSSAVDGTLENSALPSMQSHVHGWYLLVSRFYSHLQFILAWKI